MDNANNFARLQIVVVGDVMLDEYVEGDVHRLSQEAPVPILNARTFTYRLGGAANVASNLRALGCNVHLIALVGKDSAASQLAVLLEEKGIRATLVNTDQPTIRKVRYKDRRQHFLRVDFEGTFGTSYNTRLVSLFQDSIINANACILSDYAKGTLTDPREFIQIAKQHHAKVFVDPKRSDISMYAHADFVTPNEKELSAMLLSDVSDQQCWLPPLQKLMQQHDIACVLHTQGARGMTLVSRGANAVHVQACNPDAVDVTGAGDTVIATFCAFVCAGFKSEEAIHYANKAARVVVGKVGVSSVCLKDLIDIRSSQDDKNHFATSGSFENPNVKTNHQTEIHSKMAAVIENGDMINPSNAEENQKQKVLSEISAAKEHGDVIVMTNGCFDILHSGHITYLKQARALGDRLVVAVNSDASVRALKGTTRPINDVNERVAILSALKVVDWVLVFDDLTPEEIVKAVSPKYLVKGGDYVESQVIGGDIVRAYGGEVKIMPLVVNKSTTKLISKIKDRNPYD